MCPKTQNSTQTFSFQSNHRQRIYPGGPKTHNLDLGYSICLTLYGTVRKFCGGKGVESVAVNRVNPNPASSEPGPLWSKPIPGFPLMYVPSVPVSILTPLT